MIKNKLNKILNSIKRIMFNGARITLTSLIAALACTGIIYAATTVGTNISTTGTLDVTGNSIFTTASSTGIVKFSQINSDTGAISFGNENLSTTGNLTITGSTTLEDLIIDVTNTEAFLVRKDSDGGDVFTVDTVGLGNISATSGLYQGAKYIIFRSGSTYYAQDGQTGAIYTSSSNPSTVINAAIDNLTAARTWKEKVVLAPAVYDLTEDIEMESYTILEINGVINAVPTGGSMNIISNTGGSDIDIIGGTIDGKNQPDVLYHSYNCVYFSNVDRFTISGVRLIDCGSEGLEIVGGSSNGRITDNIISGSADDGISILDYSYNIDISGNDIFNVRASAAVGSAGIEIEDGSYDITISSNRIHDDAAAIWGSSVNGGGSGYSVGDTFELIGGQPHPLDGESLKNTIELTGTTVTDDGSGDALVTTTAAHGLHQWDMVMLREMDSSARFGTIAGTTDQERIWYVSVVDGTNTFHISATYRGANASWGANSTGLATYDWGKPHVATFTVTGETGGVIDTVDQTEWGAYYVKPSSPQNTATLTGGGSGASIAFNSGGSIAGGVHIVLDPESSQTHSKNITVANNVVYNLTNSGIDSSAAKAGELQKNIVFTGNTITEVRGGCLKMQTTEGGVISGNAVLNCGTGNAIAFGSGVLNGVISSNTIARTNTYSIELFEADNIIVSDNTITDTLKNYQPSILVNTSNDIIVSGNTIVDTVGAALMVPIGNTSATNARYFGNHLKNTSTSDGTGIYGTCTGCAIYDNYGTNANWVWDSNPAAKVDTGHQGITINTTGAITSTVVDGVMAGQTRYWRVSTDNGGTATLTFTGNCPGVEDTDTDGNCSLLLEELRDTVMAMWDGVRWQIVYDLGGAWTDL